MLLDLTWASLKFLELPLHLCSLSQAHIQSSHTILLRSEALRRVDLLARRVFFADWLVAELAVAVLHFNAVTESVNDSAVPPRSPSHVLSSNSTSLSAQGTPELVAPFTRFTD